MFALPPPPPPALFRAANAYAPTARRDDTPQPTPQAETNAPASIPEPDEVVLSGLHDVKPWKAGWASALFPGGGFFYLRRSGRGAAYLGVETIELTAVVATVANSGYDPSDPSTNARLDRVLLPGVWLQDTHLTGIYDAYRAARVERHNLGYRTPIPEPGLAGLLRAPFEGHTLIRPRIALPLALVAVGGAAFSLWYRDHAPAGSPTYWQLSRAPLLSRDVPNGRALAANEANYAGAFYAVGIGEEALFRGVLQTTFEEWWGTTPGILAGSAVFGIAHFANDPALPLAALGNVAFTSVLGTYLGWMYVDDGHDLRAGVAFHVWYDFLVGSAYFLADPAHQPLSARMTIPF